MVINIEERKKEVISDLRKLETECNILLERISVYIDTASKITTFEEAVDFDEALNDIGKGLEIILLWWV